MSVVKALVNLQTELRKAGLDANVQLLVSKKTFRQLAIDLQHFLPFDRLLANDDIYLNTSLGEIIVRSSETIAK